MKHFIECLAVLFLAVGISVHAEERITVSVGDTTNVTLPFVIEKFQLNIPGLAMIKSLSDTQLSITGKKQGEGKLDVTGGGITKKYILAVTGNTAKIISRLRNDLQDIPEISVSMNQNTIVVRGNISKYEKWKSFQSIMAYYKNEKIHDFVRFVPSAETVLSLKKELENLGYRFSEDKAPEPGYLSVRLSPNSFFLSGKVFSESEKAEIMALLKNQAWLSLQGKNEGKVPGYINISVVKTQVVVDLAFIALSKKDVDTLGNQGGVPSANFDFKILYDIISGATDKTAKIGANLAQTVSFFSRSGISRTYKAGSVSFTNGINEGYLKVGGTQYVKVRGRDDGDLKEINYGFIVTVKGEIINRRQIRLNINLEYSHMTDELNKEESSIRTERIVEFDKTAIIGGFKDITRSISNDGMPVLRNTPVVQWFVSQRNDSELTSDLLILVSPRVSSDTEVEIPVNRNPENTVRESQQSNAEYKKSQKKYSGWLYWLNWFVW